MKKKQIVYQIVAFLMLITFSQNILFSKELSLSYESGKTYLEHYMQKAFTVRENSRWNEIAEEGITKAIAVWEAKCVLENDQVILDEEREEIYEKFLEILDEKKNEWLSVINEERVNQYNFRNLRYELNEKSAEWTYITEEGEETRRVAFEEAENVKNQWKQEVENYISDSYELTAETKMLLEWETSSLLSDILYDKASLKKIKDSETAYKIASEIATSVEDENNASLTKLLSSIQTELETYSDEEIEINTTQWLTSFKSALDEASSKWDHAEQTFLYSKLEWQTQVENSALEGEEAWQNAYEELNARRQNWSNEITQKINELKETLSSRSLMLYEQIEKDLSSYEELLLSSYTSCMETFSLYQNIYLQSLQMAELDTSNAEYWSCKAEESVKNMYDCIGVSFSDYKNISSLDSEILKSKALIEFYENELTVVNAVLAYKENNSSLLDTANETQEKLSLAKEEYEASLLVYEKALSVLEELKNTELLSAEENLNAALAVLENAQSEIEEAQSNYNQALEIFSGVTVSSICEYANSISSLINALSYSAEEKESKFYDYVGALVVYEDELLSKTKDYLLESITYGDEENGVPSLSTLNYLSEINKDIVLDSSFDVETVKSKVCTLDLEQISYLEDLLYKYFDESTGDDELEVLEIYITDALESFCNFYKEELLKRKCSIEYLTGVEREKSSSFLYWDEASSYYKECISGIFSELGEEKIKNSASLLKDNLSMSKEEFVSYAVSLLTESENVSFSISKMIELYVESAIKFYVQNVASFSVTEEEILSSLEYYNLSLTDENYSNSDVYSAYVEYLLYYERFLYLSEDFSKYLSVLTENENSLSLVLEPSENYLDLALDFFTNGSLSEVFENLENINVNNLDYSTCKDSLYENSSSRLMYVLQLKSILSLLEEASASDEEKKKVVTEAKEIYKQKENSLEIAQNEYLQALELYAEKIELYNDLVEKTELLYDEVLTSLLALRISEEITRWAEFSYLHGDVSCEETGYIPPEQQKENLLSLYEEALENYNLLIAIKENENTYELIQNELSSYKDSFDAWYNAKNVECVLNEKVNVQKQKVREAESNVLTLSQNIIPLSEEVCKNQDKLEEREEALESLIYLSNSGNLEKVSLACIYVLIQNGILSEDDISYASDASKLCYQSGSYKINEAYENARSKALENVYKEVSSDSSLSSWLEKLVKYRTDNIITKDTLNMDKIALELLSEKAMEQCMSYLDGSKSECEAVAIWHTAQYAIFSALSIFAGPAMFALAATQIALCITFASLAKEYEEGKKIVQNVFNSTESSRQYYKKLVDDSILKYTDALAELKSENEILLSLTECSTDGDTSITWESYINFLLAQTESKDRTSFDYMKDAFYAVQNEGVEFASCLSAVSSVADYLESELYECRETLCIKEKSLNSELCSGFNECTYFDLLFDFYSDYLLKDFYSGNEYVSAELSSLLEKKLTSEMQNLISIRSFEGLIQNVSLENQIAEAENQIDALLYLADIEWLEAEKKINDSYNSWRKNFVKNIGQKEDLWESEYAFFLAEKQKWLCEQYMYAQNIESYSLLQEININCEEKINQSLINLGNFLKNESIIGGIEESLDEYLDGILDLKVLNALSSSSLSFFSSLDSVCGNFYSCKKINSGSLELYRKALVAQSSIDREMKNRAAALAVEEAKARVEEIKDAFLAQIKAENECKEEEFLYMARESGYVVGNEISRTVVSDSSVSGSEWQNQTLRKYKWFEAVLPDIGITFNGFEDSMELMEKTNSAYDSLNAWYEDVFGRTQDGSVNTFKISRSVADVAGKSHDTSLYEKSQKENESNFSDYEKVIELLSDENSTQEEKADAYKKYLEYTKTLVEVRGGAFGEYLGYAPVFKDFSEIDIKAGMLKNVECEGRGETGAIMLEFMWNDIIKDHGMQEFNKAFYDKKLYLTTGVLEAPTIRDVASLALTVSGTAVGAGPVLSAALNLADDIVFGALDVTMGYQDASSVALNLGKSIALTGISMGLNSATSFAGSFVNDIKDFYVKGFSKGLLSASSSYLSSVASGYVNALSWDGENFIYDIETANSSWYSKDTISSATGAGVLSFSNLMTKSNINYTENKFFGSAIQLSSIALSKASEFGVMCVCNDGNLQNAFDDMSLTFNVLDLGSVFDLMDTIDARISLNGQSSDFLVANARKFSGTGLLEVNLSSSGVKARIGSSGTNIGNLLYDAIKRGTDYAVLNSYGNKSNMDAGTVWYNYVYGDRTQENTSFRIANHKDTLNFVSATDVENGCTAQTVCNENGGRTITLVNSGNVFTNAISLGHESYRNGIVDSLEVQQEETRRAVLAHTEEAFRMMSGGEKIGFAGNLCNDLGQYISAMDNGELSKFYEYIEKAYDSSADYWKLIVNTNDFTHELVYDGNEELSVDYIDKDGEVISTMTPDGQDLSGYGMSGSLVKIIGIQQAQKLIGSDYTDISIYDEETLRDVLSKKGYSEQDINRMLSNEDSIQGSLKNITFTEQEICILLGDVLMKKMGASWNGNEWVNESGVSLNISNDFCIQSAITDKVLNGNILAEVSSDGRYLYSTVNATIYRDPRSLNSVTSKDGVNWYRNTKNLGLDYVLYKKEGINYDYFDAILLNNYQTVDNLVGMGSSYNYAQPYARGENDYVQGNTIVSENFNLGYYTDSRGDSSFENKVLVANNATTLSGEFIGNDGNVKTDTASENLIGRWLFHDDTKWSYDNNAWIRTDYLASDGCCVTDVQNQIILLNTLKRWNVGSGYQIHANLITRAYTGY